MARASRARGKRAQVSEPPPHRPSPSARLAATSVSSVRFADADDVTDLARNLRQTHLDCRDVGHSWREWDADEIHDQRLGHRWERILRCKSCRGTRTEYLDAYGEIVQTRYSYPDGYATKGLGRIASKGAFRVENMRRKRDGRR